MTAQALGVTAALFARAVETVRNAPLPREVLPAFTLPSIVPPTPAMPVDGRALGLAGDLTSVADAIRDGRIGVEEVVGSAMASIARHDAEFGAFEAVADVSREVDALAAEARAGRSRGPLHGIPISIKDVIDVAGLPTAGSSRAIPVQHPDVDAEAVARLRAAGAVIVGKAVTHEFALGVTTPQSRNPWDARRVPGGSSGGSAISLVTGMALGSLGTDTRASIRVPAALMGLVGFKPSLGVVPVDRWLTLSWTMDHFAPMARSVRDIALMMDVLTRGESSWRRVLPGSLAGLRVGTSPAFMNGTEPGVRAAFDDALAAMAAAGGRVVPLERPTDDDLDLANAAGMIVSRAEAAQVHRELGTQLDRCISEVRDQLVAAEALLATDYVRALRLRQQLRDRFEAVFESVDLLAMPTSRVVAPPRENADDYLLVLSANCIPWSFVDFPAISLFAGMVDGLPAGIQLVAGPGRDRHLLSAAHAFEQAAGKAPRWGAS